MIFSLLTAVAGWALFGVVSGFISGRRVGLGLLVTIVIVFATHLVLAYRMEIYSAKWPGLENLVGFFFEQAGLLLLLWIIPALIGFEVGQRVWKHRIRRHLAS